MLKIFCDTTLYTLHHLPFHFIPTMPYNVVREHVNMIQRNTIQRNKIQYNTIQWNLLVTATMQSSTHTQYNHWVRECSSKFHHLKMTISPQKKTKNFTVLDSSKAVPLVWDAPKLNILQALPYHSIDPHRKCETFILLLLGDCVPTNFQETLALAANPSTGKPDELQEKIARILYLHVLKLRNRCVGGIRIRLELQMDPTSTQLLPKRAIWATQM